MGVVQEIIDKLWSIVIKVMLVHVVHHEKYSTVVIVSYSETNLNINFYASS